MLAACHGLEKLFGNDFGPVRLARRIGIAAVDRMPRLKRAFAERAMGMGPGVTGLLAAGLLRGLRPGGDPPPSGGLVPTAWPPPWISPGERRPVPLRAASPAPPHRHPHC